MTGIDPYAVLGVTRDASQDDITRAYRAQVRRHHPDTRTLDDESQGAASDAELQLILAAYAILHDPRRRADHDRRSGTHVARDPRRVPVVLPQRPPIQAGPVLWFPDG